jgi:hypothetical protein
MMRHVLKPELLNAMKESLRALENVKMLSPDDIEILRFRRTLRQKIDELEKQEGSDGYELVTLKFSRSVL